MKSYTACGEKEKGSIETVAGGLGPELAGGVYILDRPGGAKVINRPKSKRVADTAKIIKI